MRYTTTASSLLTLFFIYTDFWLLISAGKQSQKLADQRLASLVTAQHHAPTCFGYKGEPLDGDDVKGLTGHAEHARTRPLLGTVQKKYVYEHNLRRRGVAKSWQSNTSQVCVVFEGGI